MEGSAHQGSCGCILFPRRPVPAWKVVKKLIEEVIRKALEEVILKNGLSVSTLYGDRTDLYIQPSGKLIIGGRQGCARLSGRKKPPSTESVDNATRWIDRWVCVGDDVQLSLLTCAHTTRPRLHSLPQHNSAATARVGAPTSHHSGVIGGLSELGDSG